MKPLLLFIAIMIAWTSEAGPCSCNPEPPPLFLVSSGSVVPSNFRGVPCSAAVAGIHWDVVPLYRLGETETRIPFQIRRLVYPDDWAGRSRRSGVDSLTIVCADWIPGERYRLGSGPHVTEFSVSTTPFVSDSCNVEVWEDTHDTVTTFGGASCSVRFMAHRVGIEMSNEVLRWGDGLLYYTVVDGKIWRPTKSLCAPRIAPGRSWVGSGRELLFCGCEWKRTLADIVLGAGQHEVTMIAWLPGVQECRATTTVRLGCD